MAWSGIRSRRTIEDYIVVEVAMSYPLPAASLSHPAAPPDNLRVDHKSPFRTHFSALPTPDIVHDPGNSLPMDNPSNNTSSMRHGSFWAICIEA
jgi:hypothetical protein